MTVCPTAPRLPPRWPYTHTRSSRRVSTFISYSRRMSSATRNVLSMLPALGRVGAQQAAGAAASLLFTRGYADLSSLKKTMLYDFHVAHGGACPGAERFCMQLSRAC